MTVVHCTRDFPWKWNDQVSKVQHHEVETIHTDPRTVVIRCRNCGYEMVAKGEDDCSALTFDTFTV